MFFHFFSTLLGRYQPPSEQFATELFRRVHLQSVKYRKQDALNYAFAKSLKSRHFHFHRYTIPTICHQITSTNTITNNATIVKGKPYLIEARTQIKPRKFRVEQARLHP